MGGAAAAVVEGRQYDLNMSLIRRAEARRKSVLAVIDPPAQAHLDRHGLLGAHAVEAS